MMRCIFYGFIGDPPRILLCKHDHRIVKSTHQHVEPSKKHTIHTPTWELIGTVTWVYTNTRTRELNRYGRTGPTYSGTQ